MESLLYVDHLATRSLALKNHLTPELLDFIKAFNKIGTHSDIATRVESRPRQNELKF